MRGYLSLILHAHLPFVRHPEHEKFLEENWFYEAIVECYLPLIGVLEGWRRDGMGARITLSLSPTLCSMLKDHLLCDRFSQRLNALIELAEKETHRTFWDKELQPLAVMYHDELVAARNQWNRFDGDLISAFRQMQDAGLLELITCAATHPLLPLFENHPPALRAQILTARDFHESCFGRPPRGIWLPECAYAQGVETFLQEANIRWFITDTHGLLHARPRPRYGHFAPVFTPNGIAVFGRDLESAKQVWSRDEGYPGDPRYRDFYRDIAFDLDLDYIKPYLPAPPHRTFTGIKYYRITGHGEKQVYQPRAAIDAAGEHAHHFLQARLEEVGKMAGVMDLPPLLAAPYDAELFGHWWYEGPRFLDFFVRKAWFDQEMLRLITPSDYLETHPTHQVARPSSSSWGEEGYWKVWLNETNEWIFPHLQINQERLSELARLFPHPDELTLRALKQAARELMLAQASDWPFILRTGASPDYARQRVKDHLLRFIALHEQLTSTRVDEGWLAQIEALDNIFPDIKYEYWA